MSRRSVSPGASRPPLLDELRQDLRFALRMLFRSPGFSLVAVLTLALGIGANSAIFSVVNGVLLRPLPYSDPDGLVSVWPDGGFPPGGFLAFRDEARSFSAVAGYAGSTELTLVDDGEPARLEGVATTADLFGVLGVEAALGRTFLPEEERPEGERVVLLGHALWQQRFGGDPGVVGRQLRLDGEARTVVGVMPADFRFPSPSTQLWLPVAFDPSDRIGMWAMGWLSPVGRLRPGAGLKAAQAEVDAFLPRLREMFPWDMPEEWGRGAAVVPLRDRVVGDVRPMLLILLGAVGFVLLIACANVANLLLARAAARQREIAIRGALGAGRGRLVRQLLTESAVLAAAGGALGLALGVAGVELLSATLPADTPRLAEIGIDGAVLAFTAVLALLTALLFGSLPALRASGAGMEAALAEGGRTAGGGRSRRRLAGGLVVVEVALSVVLVIGAGLLVKSFLNVLRVDPGFRTENVVSAMVAPPEFRFPDDEARRDFFDGLQRRLEVLPGVVAAAATSQLPFSDGIYSSVFLIEGRPDPATRGGDWPLADAAPVVGPDFLRALGIPLLRGRGFTEGDREDSPGVVLVSEALARRYWPGEDPVGQRISFPDAPREWSTVVGVVGDVKWEALTEEGKSALYVPLAQARTGPMRMVVRTTGDPRALVASLRGVVASLDAQTPVSDVRTVEQLISSSLQRPRFAMLLLARLRRRRPPAGGGGDLRGDRARGGAEDPRDRGEDRAGRPLRRRAPAGADAGGGARPRGGGGGAADRLRRHPGAPRAPLRGGHGGSAHLLARPPSPGGGGAPGQLDPGPPGGAGGADGRPPRRLGDAGERPRPPPGAGRPGILPLRPPQPRSGCPVPGTGHPTAVRFRNARSHFRTESCSSLGPPIGSKS